MLVLIKKNVKSNFDEGVLIINSFGYENVSPTLTLRRKQSCNSKLMNDPLEKKRPKYKKGCNDLAPCCIKKKQHEAKLSELNFKMKHFEKEKEV